MAIAWGQEPAPWLLHGARSRPHGVAMGRLHGNTCTWETQPHGYCMGKPTIGKHAARGEGGGSRVEGELVCPGCPWPRCWAA